MKKFSLLFFFLCNLSLWAQTAQQVLDKSVSWFYQNTLKIHFTSTSYRGKSSGTVTTQQNKFTLNSSQADIWYDGRTEWAYTKGTNEVNITTPSSTEATMINPIYILQAYKKGYQTTMYTKGDQYKIHLKALKSKQTITEAHISINKRNMRLMNIQLQLNHTEWVMIHIHEIQKIKKQPNSYFQFNPQEYPQLSIIDLR